MTLVGGDLIQARLCIPTGLYQTNLGPRGTEGCVGRVRSHRHRKTSWRSAEPPGWKVVHPIALRSIHESQAFNLIHRPEAS